MKTAHFEKCAFPKIVFALGVTHSRMHLNARYLSCDPMEIAISRLNNYWCTHNAYLQKALHKSCR